MARTFGSSGPATLEAIRRAGLRLIYEQGYEAVSLRQLAAEIGMAQGSLYNHFATKQELLFLLISGHMSDLLAHADEALQGLTDPSERLVAFVEFHVNYHIDRKQEVFICYSELRSLEKENFEAITAMRREYEQKLIAILRAGIERGVFTIADPQAGAFGILSMLAGICTWYNPKGRLSKKQIAALFVEMVQGAVQDRSSPAVAKGGRVPARSKARNLA